MPTVLQDPVAHLIARHQLGVARWIVGMAGVPGSGKSTLAAQIVTAVNAQLGEGAMVALSMDGFHLPKAALRAMPNPEEAFARRGAPWTFDAAALRERLRALREAAGHSSVPWPDFQHDIGDPREDAFTIAPDARFILVEGLYLLHNDTDWAPIARQFDERWFLDTPPDVALERLAQRHMRAWGFSRDQALHRIATSDGLNAELVMRSRGRADWLVE